MANMSYCKFRNTLADLIDCQDTLNQNCFSSLIDGEKLSHDEMLAAIELLYVVQEIAIQFEDINENDLKADWAKLKEKS
jgi:hypothetical protein